MRRTPKKLRVALCFGIGALALSACDPTGHVESVRVSADGNGITVDGWALDHESGSPIDVTVAVAGGGRSRAATRVARPDVQTVYTKAPANSGYSVTVPAPVGRQTVCVALHNVGRGKDVLNHCSSVVVPPREPIGVLESLRVEAESLVASGWAADPDAGRAINVALLDFTDDPLEDAQTITRRADEPRPDVVVATGIAGAGGFRLDMPIRVYGERNICVVAVNENGGSDQFLGCRVMNITDQRPHGSVTSVTINGSNVTVSGRATDPDGGPVSVAIPGVGTLSSNGTWTTTVSRGDGVHRFCPTLIDVPGAAGVSGDRKLPCASAVLGDIDVTATGVTSGAAPIRSATPALADVDRDGGVSVRLSDGSVLWLFGDTVSTRPDGSLNYFVGGTAAWAPASNPRAPQDAIDGAGRPYLYAAPSASFPACSAGRPHRVQWPLSATTVRDGSIDRVIVYLSNMCLGTSGWDMEPRGVAVAEYRYDPANPPANRPVQLTLLNQNLFPTAERAFGMGTVADSAGTYVYSYQCDTPGTGATGYGPCRIARVDPAQVANRTAYRFWDGSNWVANIGAATPINMPKGAVADWNLDFPAASMGVVWDQSVGLYTMVYSPWPGLTAEAAVRFSETPLGPWTHPISVQFEGCDNLVRGTRLYCYAATAQPWLSGGGQIGLGLYDQASSFNSRNGQYIVAAAPVSARRTNG